MESKQAPVNLFLNLDLNDITFILHTSTFLDKNFYFKKEEIFLFFTFQKFVRKTLNHKIHILTNGNILPRINKIFILI